MDFLETLTKEYAWPKRGEKLFAPSDHGDHVELEQDARYRSVYLVRGYKEAADALVEKALTLDNFFIEPLVYPTVFLYRHFLELALKQMIVVYAPLARIKPPKFDHRLSKLLSTYLQVSEALGGVDTSADALLELVAQFEAVDPDSFAFRYANSKDGEPMASSLPIHVDLGRVRQVMAGVDAYFDAADSYFHDLRTSAS